MAVKGLTALTLADWGKRVDKDGKIDKIIELLAQTNPILQDMLIVEGNLATGHKTTIRTGLPSATWRLLNYGVPQGKSTTAQVTDTVGMLEAYAEIDKSLADLNGNTAEFRLSEDRAFIEAMNQQMAQTLFYGDTSINPERFMGLASRYSSKSAGNSQNIIDAGGTGTDNTSIWLIVWGENTCHGIFPKGQKAGLQHQDLGEQTLFDPNGGKYQGYRSHYKWDNGLVLRDWRYVVRIANIDVSDLSTGSAANIVTQMVKALHRIPNRGMGKPVFYMNRTVAQALDLQSLDKASLALSVKETEGEWWTTFRGIPLRETDAILETEARVL
ncbi:major capsid protein [Pectobacterium zantedeschiae]|uniref:major capsid protein n=1 Tax=Pectobacterium zantedeschiae TaxID=2034769 RepID=UPI0032EBD46B